VEFDSLEVDEFNDLSHAKDQLNRACVMPMLYPEDNHEPLILSVGPIDQVILESLLGSNGSSISGRDIPMSTSEYWAIRVVTIHSFASIPVPNGNLQHAGGVFVGGANTIFLCRNMIEGDVADWNQDKSDNINSNQSLAATLLHELCHVLIDDYERNVYVAENTYLEETYCVRDTFFERCAVSPKYPNARRPDMRARLTYSYLIDANISDIQRLSFAQN